MNKKIKLVVGISITISSLCYLYKKINEKITNEICKY